MTTFNRPKKKKKHLCGHRLRSESEPESESAQESDACGSLSVHQPPLHRRVQKKTTSVSLTIRSASPKAPEALPHRSTLVQALSQPMQRVYKGEEDTKVSYIFPSDSSCRHVCFPPPCRCRVQCRLCTAAMRRVLQCSPRLVYGKNIFSSRSSRVV